MCSATPTDLIEDGSIEETMEAVAVPYRTEDLVPREGLYGTVMRFAADRPYLAGFAGGVFANAVAFLKAPGVVDSALFEAIFLGLAVMVSWVVLFGLMRPFFEAQAWRTEYVSRLLVYDGAAFQFIEEDVVQRSISDPTFRIVTRPVPDEVLESEEACGQPWKVWLMVVGGDDDVFVLATKLAAREASEYEAAAADIEERVDEALPTHVASPFLILGRHRNAPLDDASNH